MEKQIITGPLDTAQRIALEEYMYNKIKDAMRYDGKCVAWYKLSVDISVITTQAFRR